MFKYAEINLVSGNKVYLYKEDTQEGALSRQVMDYILNGSYGASLLVRATNSASGDKVYVNPRFIESFKLVLE